MLKKGSLLNRLDRTLRELDPLLPTQQLQQDEHPLMRTQDREHPNPLAQRTEAAGDARALVSLLLRGSLPGLRLNEHLAHDHPGKRNTRTMQGETQWTMTSKSLNASTIALTRGT